jgi:hypothetical protein
MNIHLNYIHIVIVDTTVLILNLIKYKKKEFN